MAGWSEVLKEISETQSQQDYIRRKYLTELSDYTGRMLLHTIHHGLNTHRQIILRFAMQI